MFIRSGTWNLLGHDVCAEEVDVPSLGRFVAVAPEISVWQGLPRVHDSGARGGGEPVAADAFVLAPSSAIAGAAWDGGEAAGGMESRTARDSLGSLTAVRPPLALMVVVGAAGGRHGIGLRTRCCHGWVTVGRRNGKENGFGDSGLVGKWRG